MSDTICRKFLESATKHAARTAIMFKRGGRWHELSWQGYREVVESVAAGFQTLGLRKGDKVAIFSHSRFEWAVTDLAVLGLGGVIVPIYQSSTPEDIAYILNDAEVRFLICETAASARKVRESTKNVKTLEKILCFDGDKKKAATTDAPTSGDQAIGTNEADEFMTLDTVQRTGETALKHSPALYELAEAELSLEDTATIIYTSGTTGQPKGVVLTHTQALSEVSDAFPLLGATPRDRDLSFLPYAHILGRIQIWGHALIGHTLAFAESIDRLKHNLMEVKPTFMIAVPRVFEKIYNGILAQAEISPLRSRTFHWAISVGREMSKYKVEKQPVPIELAIRYQLARRLVFNAISERMGGQLRFAMCGGAPLSRPIAEFFHAAGLLILEGYGLTETTAAVAVNTPFDYRFGTVGRPMGDVRIQIAEDGEILVHSKKVMKGYHKDPEATAQVIKDGWFHTGDIGEISPEGYLRITDRKKDLIKTAGGKYVAPQKLEGLLKTNRFISQVHIHGDQRKYVVALLTLNYDQVEKYASENEIVWKDRESLIENPKVKELARRAVADANSHLASFESIKNFAVLPRDFTIESGELTHSLKIKRKVVDQNYRDLIEHLYGHERGSQGA